MGAVTHCAGPYRRRVQAAAGSSAGHPYRAAKGVGGVGQTGHMQGRRAQAGPHRAKECPLGLQERLLAPLPVGRRVGQVALSAADLLGEGADDGSEGVFEALAVGDGRQDAGCCTPFGDQLFDLFGRVGGRCSVGRLLHVDGPIVGLPPGLLGRGPGGACLV